MDGENHVSEIASTYIRIVFMYKSAQYSSFSQETLAVQITILRMQSCILLRVWLELQI